MAINYGIDYTIFAGNPPDLDLTFTTITDFQQVLLEDAYKKITTVAGIVSPPTGQFWDTNTMNLKGYFLNTLSLTEQATLKSRIEAVFETELRYSAIATVSFVNEILRVQLDLYPSTDPRPLSIIFSSNSPDVIFQRSS